ncbi:MAG TPA: methyltransferase domain-containing protein [Vicinamibacterales bacterium]|nr:methyltransferase domain-containing protein [Vicinamibacterales bacterium]
MARHIDSLIDPTLKHLRERWWDSDFSEFLAETLRPRPGRRILDVGCGDGTAELSLGRLKISQIDLFAVDKRFDRVAQTAENASAHNVRVKVAAADAMNLPFANDTFDSTFCVAVLQHVRDVTAAVRELARVTKPGGRIVAVEPDNAARYWFSSIEEGQRAYEAGSKFFAAAIHARGDGTDPSVGPKLTGFFAASRVEPLSVDLFPVSVTRLGPPPAAIWRGRREAIARLLEGVDDPNVQQLADEYRRLLDAYEQAASRAGAALVEIQNTMLFAAVGQKPE